MAKEEKKKDSGDKAAKADVPADEAAKASGKKRLLLFAIGGAVVLAAIGGGITFFLASGNSGTHAAQAATDHQEKATSEHKEAGPGEHKEAQTAGKSSDQKADQKEAAKKEAPSGDKKEPEKKDAHSGDKKEGDKSQKGADAKKPGGDDSTVKIEGIDFGCAHTFPMFNLNLGNPLENRYMRLEVAVEYGCGPEAKAELDRRAPQLRDAIASVARRKTREFMLGPDGLDQLRKEIHIKLNSLLTHKVDKVFITDILIE